MDKYIDSANRLLLEGKFEEAQELLNKVIENDVTCFQAYFLLLLVKYRVRNIEELITCEKEIDNEKLYKLAYQFGDPLFRQDLIQYSKQIKEYISEIKKERYYIEALTFYNEQKYQRALDSFKWISKYKDSPEYIRKCEDAINQEKYLKGQKAENENLLFKAIRIYSEILDYKDSAKRVDAINTLIDKENTYIQAKSEAETKITWQVERAIVRLKAISDYKDSALLIEKYQRLVEEYKVRDLEVNKKRKKARIKIAVILTCAFSLLLSIIFVLMPWIDYMQAKSYLDRGNLNLARDKFVELDSYLDSEKYIIDIDALLCLEENDYEGAINVYANAKNKIIVNYVTNGIEEERVISETISSISELRTDFENYGYHFNGYTYSNGEVDIDKHVLTIDLIVNYELTTSIINLDLNYGVGKTQYTYSVFDEFVVETPTRTGYSFVGWLEEGGNTIIEEIKIEKDSKGDRYFTAQWEVEMYNVNYYVNNELIYTEKLLYTDDLVFYNSYMIDDLTIVKWEMNGTLYSPGHKYPFRICEDTNLYGVLAYVNDDFEFKIEPNGKATITGLKDNTKENVIIPGYVLKDGKYFQISKIDSQAFVDNATLKTIFIPSNVNIIRQDSFVNCENLVIYCQDEESKSSWKEGWNNGITTYYNCDRLTYLD